MKLNVTANGGISSGEKVKGVKYMDEKEARAHLRKNEVSPVYGSAGEVLAKSKFAITTAEAKKIGAQKIQFGQHAGKKLEDVPELFDMALGKTEAE